MSKSTLIKNVIVLDQASKWHQKTVNILVENGNIAAIGDELFKADEEYDGDQAFISAGWLAYDVDCGLPGREVDESMTNMLNAAQAGGFTGVFTAPIDVDQRALVEYITKSHKFENTVVDLYPTASSSLQGAGKEMSEMYDMQSAGALIFGDEKSTENAGVLLRSLLYMRDFKAKAQIYSKDDSLSRDAAVFEGRQATLQGLKAMPELAVETRLQRDLALQEYTETPCVFKDLSTVNSIDLVADQKKRGFEVYASLPAYLLVLNDECLHEFDTAYKLDPPLRSDEIRLAFMEALKDGKIDVISCKHRGLAIEHKAVEFEHAAFGMINLQTMIPSLFEAMGQDLYQFIPQFSNNLRKFVNVAPITFEIGGKAEFTLFKEEVWKFDTQNNLSLNNNSPFLDRSFKLKVKALVNHNEIKKVS